jgi:hypothetical protein
MNLDEYLTNLENEVGQMIMKEDAKKNNNIIDKILNYLTHSNKKSNKKFDISVIGGINYSNDTKLGIGIVAAGLYNTGNGDSITHYSNVSLYGNVTITGFYTIGIEGNHICPKEKYIIDYSTYFSSFPSKFWGLGYFDGNNNANKSEYLSRRISGRGTFLYQLFPSLYIGPRLGFDFTMGSKFSNVSLIEGRDKIYRAFNYGLTVSYDTRDMITNAWKGIYFTISQIFYNYIHCKPFFKTDFQFNFYQKIWKGGILATDTYCSIGYGDTPWTFLETVGGSTRMRGYYSGRYRDENMIALQVELRQKIYGRHGMAAWAGAGNLWGNIDKFNWKHTLPTFGIGYRWEFKKRVNLRLDFGIGKDWQYSFLFGINEAF